MAKYTDQQIRIRDLRAAGKTTAEIAKALGITEAGVRSCMSYQRRTGKKPGRPPNKAVA